MRRFLAPWLIFFALILAAASALSLAGRWHWLADLFTHFVPHYLVAGVPLLLLLAWTRRYVFAALVLVVVLWNGWLFHPYVAPQRAAAPTEGNVLELLQFNLSGDNPMPLAAIGYVMTLDEPPDVIVLLETTPAFALSVKRLNQIYPTIAQMPRDDNFGIAVLSRLKDSEVEFRQSELLRLPWMVLSGTVGGQSIRVYALHAPPPLNETLSRARNVQIEQLANEIASKDDHHVIVAGDLNTTIWSHAFTPLAATAGLSDAQRGRGYLPTWAPPPLVRWIGLPIDHTLVSDNLVTQSRYAGPWLASDHWPVHTRLKLR